MHLLCGLPGAGKTVYAPRWRKTGLIWDLALQVLALGHDVVLDWNQWSHARRADWRGRVQSGGYPVRLRYLATPVEVAIPGRGLSGNRRAGSHLLDAAAVRHMDALLEIPDPSEGIEIVRVLP